MPFLLLDDATEEAKRRLQEFGTQTLQSLTQTAQGVGQQAQGVTQSLAGVGQQAQSGLADVTSRLQDFGQQQLSSGIQTLQPLQQPAQNAQQTISRLQDFGSSQLQSLTQPQPQQQTDFNTFQQPSQGAIDSSTPQSFAQTIAPYAKWAADQLGLDPSWVAAMAASESNYGKAPGNELFGIKGGGTAGSQQLTTHEGEYNQTPVSQGFAAYNSPQEAAQGFVDLIKSHYPQALGAQSLQQFVHGLKSGGYFTAAEPEYLGILQSITNQIGDTVKQSVGNAVQGINQATAPATQAISGALGQQSQFGQQGLSDAEAYAACGPAAAIRFAQMYGRNPTLREATDLAAQVGWTPQNGMAGLSSEGALFDRMNIPHRTVGADWNALAREAASGNPVVISTPGHYFTADAYDPSTGAFHVGQSGKDLKAGSEWMTPQQMEGVMGRLQGGLAVDNPGVNAPSPLTQGWNSAMDQAQSNFTALGQAKDRGLQILNSAVNNVSSAVANAPNAFASAFDVKPLYNPDGSLTVEGQRRQAEGQARGYDQMNLGPNTAAQAQVARQRWGVPEPTPGGALARSEAGEQLGPVEAVTQMFPEAFQDYNAARTKAINSAVEASPMGNPTVAGVPIPVVTGALEMAGNLVTDPLQIALLASGGGLPGAAPWLIRELATGAEWGGLQGIEQPGATPGTVGTSAAEGALAQLLFAGAGRAVSQAIRGAVDVLRPGQVFTGVMDNGVIRFLQPGERPDPGAVIKMTKDANGNLVPVALDSPLAGINAPYAVAAPAVINAARPIESDFGPTVPVPSGGPSNLTRAAEQGTIAQFAEPQARPEPYFTAPPPSPPIGRPLDRPLDLMSQPGVEAMRPGFEAPGEPTLQARINAATDTVDTLKRVGASPREISFAQSKLDELLEQQARGEPAPVAPSPMAAEQPSAAPSLGGGTVGISQSPTFLRESLRRMYPGAINKAAAKETTQNFVDASRGIPGALGQIIVDNQAKTIEAIDQGKGMSPQTMEDVFVKLGGSQKPAGAAGGMGTAIKAIMANAQDTWVRSIGRDPSTGQLMDSVMHGSGDDFLGGTMHRYYALAGQLPESELAGAPPSIKDLDLTINRGAGQGTGTAIWTRPMDDVNWDEWTLDNWVKTFQRVSNVPDQRVEFTVDGKTLGPGEYRSTYSNTSHPIPDEEKPSNFIKTLSVPGADIDIYASPGTVETGYQDIHLLNNGQYQADQSVGLGGNVKMPQTLVADVRATIGPRDVGYPWNPDRNTLIDTVAKAINGFVKNELAPAIVQRENTRVAGSISSAPGMGNTGIKLVDDARIGETSYAPRLAEIARHPAYRKLASAIQDLHDNLLAELQGQVVPTAKVGPQTIEQSRMIALGVSQKWHGLNVPPSYVPGGATRGILMNPWSLWREVENSWPGASETEQISRFADLMYGTMLHEISHNIQIGGHGEEFSGVLTRLPAFLGSTMQQAISKRLVTRLKSLWPTLSQDLADDSYTLQSAASESELQRYGLDLATRRPDVGPGAPGNDLARNDLGSAGAGRPGGGEPVPATGEGEGAQPPGLGGFEAPGPQASDIGRFVGGTEGLLPHGMAVPETGYQPGTPEYTVESTLRQAAADQGTNRPNLTQAEIQGLPGMAGSKLSDLNEAREAIQTGLPAMRWYSDVVQQIAKDTGQTINPREAAVLMGATGADAGVSANYHAMLTIFRAIRKANPDLSGLEDMAPKDIEALPWFKDMMTKYVSPEAPYTTGNMIARILKGYRTGEIPIPSGAKISSYGQNFLHALSDSYDPYTTQDVWQGRLFGSRYMPNPQKPNATGTPLNPQAGLLADNSTPQVAGSDATYRSMHALTNWIARELNINPREAQAAGWGVIRSLWNDPQIGRDLALGNISLRDALQQGMQRGMFAPGQFNTLADITGQTASTTNFLAKLNAMRGRILGDPSVFDQPPPATATALDTVHLNYPGAGVGVRTDARFGRIPDVQRPVGAAQAADLNSLARLGGPVLRVPGQVATVAGKIPGLTMEHSVQAAGDNNYVHVVGIGDDAAQALGQQLGADMYTHLDPDASTVGGVRIMGLQPDEMQQLTRQLRMNGIPVIATADDALAVPRFGDMSLDDARNTYQTVRAALDNLGPDANPSLVRYYGTSHEIPGPAGPVPGGYGDTTSFAQRPDLSVGNGPAGAAAQAVRNFLVGPESELGAINPVVGAHLGGAVAGGLAGYATAPPDATQQERLERAGAGAVAGGLAPFALRGNVGRVVQAARIGSLAGGIPTLGHIALNTPVQIGLKLASDIPGNIRYPEATAAELYGALQGLRSWGLNIATTLRQPGPMASSMGGGVGPQLAETGLTGLVRLHPVLQDLARQMASHMELWRQAAQTATDAGLTRLSPAWQAEVQRLVSSPTAAMQEAVDAAGNRAALGGPIGSPGAQMGTTGTAVSRLIQDSPIMRFIVPIFNIGYKVATQGVETSPLGLVGTGWDVMRGLTGAAGGGPYAGGNWAGRGATGAVTPLAERVRNNIIGVALAYEGYQQASQGNITGEGPADPREQAALRETGWQPDSIRLGGRYFNAHLLGPVGWSLIMGANAYEATHGAGGQGLRAVPTPQGERPPSNLDMLGDLVAREGRYINSETFLNGIGQTLNAIGSTAQQGQLATREAASVFESLIPQGALLANIASSQDPYQRVTRGQTPLEQIQAAVASRLPGQRENLLPRLTATGRPEQNPQYGVGLLLPRSSVIQNDPILREAERLGVTPIAAPKTVPFGSVYDIQLTPAEQQHWEELRGAALQDAATKLMASRAYQNLATQKDGDMAQRNAFAKVAQSASTTADGKLAQELARDKAAVRPGPGSRLIPKGALAPVYSYAPGGDILDANGRPVGVGVSGP